jgi:hypothetical protein
VVLFKEEKVLLIFGVVALGMVLLAVFARYWPVILGLVTFGMVMTSFQSWANGPVERMAREQVQISHQVISDGSRDTPQGFRHRIVFTIHNGTPDYIVENLHFSCEAGRSRRWTARLRPGQTRTDALIVPYGEDMTGCVPVYQLAEVY